MIRIKLDEPAIWRTRIAVSPLWETVCGIRLLAGQPGELEWPFTTWARRARGVFSTLTTQPLRCLLACGANPMPDFLMPVPPSPTPTIEEELTALCSIDAETVEAQLLKHYGDEVPESLSGFRAEPTRALQRFADSMATYWGAAMADYWPGMRGALEEELLFRARALAAVGPDALLADLHERVRWQAPILTLVKPADGAVTTTNQRLLLIPLIFAQGSLMCSTDHPDIVAVSYQARGAAVLADQPSLRVHRKSRSSRLAALMGHGRAAVLGGLTQPSTTASLAQQLGLAVSTVSEHLASLLATELVYRSRVGRRVLYGLEPAGRALLDLLD